MLKSLHLFFFSVICLSCLSNEQHQECIQESDEIPDKIYDFPSKGKSVAIIDSILDLQGRCFRLPNKFSLIFKGGCIKNGTLIGTNTKIVGTKNIFDSVTIKGSWSIENISTSMFSNLRDPNSLRNVFALASADVDNVIHIQSGEYIVKATEKNTNVLLVPSNTKVIIDGKILLAPNSFKKYSILTILKAENVTIMGKGSLIGDRDSHIGNNGEWGMCISTYDADNIHISGLFLSKGWGDGIYIGKGTKKLTVTDCTIDNCRRQGISVIEGTEVLIKDCIITNIYGTAPEYAIDIEPNAKNHASNIVIRNVTAKNCKGGFAICTRKNNGSLIENVYIEKCKVIGNKKAAFTVKGAKNVILRNNIINDSFTKFAFNVQRSVNVNIIENSINTQQNVINDIYNVKMKGNIIRKGKLPFMKKE